MKAEAFELINVEGLYLFPPSSQLKHQILALKWHHQEKHDELHSLRSFLAGNCSVAQSFNVQFSYTTTKKMAQTEKDMFENTTFLVVDL